MDAVPSDIRVTVYFLDGTMYSDFQQGDIVEFPLDTVDYIVVRKVWPYAPGIDYDYENLTSSDGKLTVIDYKKDAYLKTCYDTSTGGGGVEILPP